MADEKQNIASKVKNSNRTRIGAALAVTALVGGGLGTMIITGNGDEALLYSGLDLTESAEIAGKLDQANIRYELRGDGASIFVPRSQVLDARMMLSEEGLPTRGALGYEIFDKSESLGATSFVQNINRVRALEGELARTITSLDIVRAARVHLVLPERRLFERESQTPSASVVLSVAGHGMTGAQVRAVRNLVAGSVPGLNLDRITVLDDKGRLLAAGAEGQDGALGAGGDANERKTAMEERIRKTVLEIVEGITGPGAARVQVAAEVDFNRITQSSETYDPDGRVLRSTTTAEETSSQSSREGEQAVTVENNIPQGEDVDGGAEDTSQSQSSRIEETSNYEISKTTRTEVIEGGKIQKLSIAVAVDDTRLIDEEGNSTFEPRTNEELERIQALVRSAVGYDEARGDLIEVVNIAFVRPDISMEGGEEAPGLMDFDKHDIMRLVELIVMLLGGVTMILLVLRPLVKGLMEPSGDAEAFRVALTGADGNPAALPGGSDASSLGLPGGMPGVEGAKGSPTHRCRADIGASQRIFREKSDRGRTKSP